jgi:hypothetical protein
MAGRPTETRGERSTWRTSAPHRRHRRSAVTQGSLPQRSRDSRSVGRTFLLKYGLLAAAEYLVADAHGFWRRFFLSGSWWPLIA